MVPRLATFCGTFLVSAAFCGTAQAYPDCTALAFDGQASVTIQAHIPDVLPLCYAFTARDGQQATVNVSKAEQMSFGVESEVPGENSQIVGDHRTGLYFVTKAGTYHILVGSDLPHGNTRASFSLTVSLK